MFRKNYWPFDDYESERRFRELTAELRASTDGGVAFFGAGASAPAGIPTWDEFHRSFLAHFGAQPSPDGPQATRAVLTDIDYHTNRNLEEALAFVKETFAAPNPRIPPLVQPHGRDAVVSAIFTPQTLMRFSLRRRKASRLRCIPTTCQWWHVLYTFTDARRPRTLSTKI